MARRADFVDSRRDKRKKQIFNGAAKVFAEKGYHTATTQEIADASGLAKGTLYEYVKSKEDILLLVIEESVFIIGGQIEKAISGIDDPKARLKRAISVHLKFDKKYRNAASVVKHETSNLSAEGKKRYSELMNIQIEILRWIIDGGIEAGYFKRVNSRLAAELFFHTCSFYFGYGAFSHQELSLADTAEFILDNFVQAIFANSGASITEI